MDTHRLNLTALNDQYEINSGLLPYEMKYTSLLKSIDRCSTCKKFDKLLVYTVLLCLQIGG